MRQKGQGVLVGSAVGALVAAVAAIAGTVCCVGPIVVAVLGVGGAIAATRLAPYRPYLLVTAICLLAIGIWRAWAARRAAVRCDSCEVRSSRWSLILLGGAALVTVASILIPMVLE